MKGFQCWHYTGKSRCPNAATHHMCAPDGHPVPGGWVCEEHGKLVIDEYEKVLGEHWTMYPIDEHDRKIESARRGYK